jgi:hypothetical protein
MCNTWLLCNWLVVLTILKNISQWEGLSYILWKIKAMFGTTNQVIISWLILDTLQFSLTDFFYPHGSKG